MTHFGEEGILIGSAAAMDPQDEIFGQYREAGILMWRGFTIDDFMNQLFSNEKDLGKGRQMPVHYGSRKLNFQTISSPLATQIPQSAGAAYALKNLLNKRTEKGNVVFCYFGEGAASEGDFHAALNFAATLECPVVFICRNNGYAISTPSREQYRGDGIAARGPSYGIATARVDGNDIFAVHHSVKEARKTALETGKPILLEMMSYRIGHHSTSDDSSKYRSSEEVDAWRNNESPSTRLRLYLEANKWWSSAEEDALRSSVKLSVLASLAAAEKVKKPSIEEIFTDVYDEIPPHLQEQKDQLNEHIKKHGALYDLNTHSSTPAPKKSGTRN